MFKPCHLATSRHAPPAPPTGQPDFRSRSYILTSNSSNAGDGLLRRCFHDMIPEPLQFSIDDNGDHHFVSDCQPLKTVIDIQSLPFRWVKLDESRKTVTIELDGRKVVYDRVAVGLHGEWICALRVGDGC